MLRLFQSSEPITLFLFFVFSAAMQLHLFVYSDIFSANYGTLAAEQLFIKWLHFDKLSQTVLIFIHIIIVTLTGILLSLLVQYGKLIPKSGLVPGIVFITLINWFPEFSTVSLPLICILFLPLFLFRIFKSYNQQQADSIVFDTGLIAAVLSLLYVPAIVFAVFGMLAIFRLRSTSPREFLIWLSGFTVIYFLMFTVVFWFDLLPEFANQFQNSFHLPDLNSFKSPVIIIRLIMIGIILMISLWFLSGKYSTNLVQVRKYFGAFVNLFIFSLAIFFIPSTPAIDQLQFCLLPLSVFVSYYFMQSKNSVAGEVMLLSMISIAIIFQYINFA